MKERHEFVKGLVTGALAVLLAGGLCFLAAPLWQKDQAVSMAHTNKLKAIEEIIDEEYLGEIDKEQMTEGMYMGLVAGLADPYSGYFTKEQYEELSSQVQGEYVGIGVVMQQDEEGTLTLVECYEGSSAAEAGILAGDVLLAVDGESVEGKVLSDISALIKHTEEDSVVLTISREGGAPREIEVPVRNVELPAVSHELLADGVGYLRISSFTHVAPAQFQTAVEALKDAGMKSLVVDLRDNTGGLLDAVCEILEEILPEGLIVYTEDKQGNREERKSSGADTLGVPLVVLVNEKSASASEIFAGAVQDHEVGTIVGTVTYGKGVVQTTRVFEDGSALKLTISHYYTPDGHDIHGVGIQPDVEVQLPEEMQEKWQGGETLSFEEDIQLQKAWELAKE